MYCSHIGLPSLLGDVVTRKTPFNDDVEERQFSAYRSFSFYPKASQHRQEAV